MKRCGLAFILITGALAFYTSLSYAGFVPINSVKSASMAGTALASSGESSAIFLNPAGIAKMKTAEISFMYSKLYVGLSGIDNLSMGSASMVLPTRFGNLGMGIARFDASDLQSENTFALSYALTVMKRIEVGATAKYLSRSYSTASDSTNDPVFRNGYSKSAIAFDMGASMKIMGPIKGALAIRNMNEPDMGLASEDRLPREIQGGFMLDLAGIGFKATADFLTRSAQSATGSRNTIPLFGFEKSIAHDRFFIRAGASTLDFTGGFGFNFKNMRLDYGMVLSRNLSENNAGTHRMGITFQFGKSKSVAPVKKTHKKVNAVGDYLED